MRDLAVQFAKFATVGVASFVVEVGVLTLIHEVLGVPTVPASVIAFCCSLLFNYLVSMRHVFQHRDDLSRTREAGMYFLLSLVGLAVNTLVMWVFREAFVSAGVDYEHSQWYLAAKVIATAMVGMWNFLSRRHWLDAGSRQ